MTSYIMYFIPKFPITLDAFTLFGLIIFFSIIAGEIVSRLKFVPRILGYIALGFILGPNVLDVVTKSMLSDARVLIDISLGLVLFNLGRYLDFTWLKHDKGLLFISIVEFSLTAILVSSFIILLELPIMPAIFVGIISATTSPIVILMVARDLASEGPVTRRAILLTSTNNFLALIIFALLLPFVDNKIYSFWLTSAHALYRLFGSLGLGFIIFKVMQSIAYVLIGKQRENQFILLICIIVIAIPFAKILNLSAMLVLLSIGISARNFDNKNALIEIDLGWISHLFFIPLFFFTGCYLELTGFWQAPYIIVICILIRFLSKGAGIMFFSESALLTPQQAVAITFALSPMAGVSIGIASRLLDYSPDLGRQLMTIIAGVIAILDLLGPIATQAAFYKTGETYHKDEKI